MAFTKTLFTTWPGISDDTTDTKADWAKLVSVETFHMWTRKCDEFVNAGKMESVHSTVVAPQTMARKFLDQTSVDEWMSWVQIRADDDKVAVIFKVLNS